MTTRRAPTYYNAEEWTSFIEDFKSSGKSRKAWCSEHGITLSSMIRWERRLAEADPDDAEYRSRFVEVGIQQMVQRKAESPYCSAGGSPARPVFTIEYGGFQLHMNEGFSEEDLRKAMRVIRDAE